MKEVGWGLINFKGYFYIFWGHCKNLGFLKPKMELDRIFLNVENSIVTFNTHTALDEVHKYAKVKNT